MLNYGYIFSSILLEVIILTKINFVWKIIQMYKHTNFIFLIYTTMILRSKITVIKSIFENIIKKTHKYFKLSINISHIYTILVFFPITFLVIYKKPSNRGLYFLNIVRSWKLWWFLSFLRKQDNIRNCVVMCSV